MKTWGRRNLPEIDLGTVTRRENASGDEVVELHIKATAPTANDDVTGRYFRGCMWLDTVANKIYQCLNASEGAAVWFSIPFNASSGNSNFFWFDGVNDYAAVTLTTWKTYANGIFPGTNLWTPDVFGVVAQLATASGTGYVRMRDVTNGNTIAEVSVTSATKSIISDTTLVNLPASPAIIEIQARRTGANMGLFAAGFYYLGV